MSGDDGNTDAPRQATVDTGGACPICDKPINPAYRPFCSKRCADIDLGRWLGERYVVPDRAVNDDDDWSSDAPDAPPTDGDPRGH
ncbi:MAG: DNA gyrase inhibitor YacG [Pseudomonadota bacterium]